MNVISLGVTNSDITNYIYNFTCDEQALCFLAGLIAQQAKIGDCFALYGDLGAGKSTFSRAFIKRLCGAATEVCSPTFTISQSYSIDCPSSQDCAIIWHYDLYRMESYGELHEIGLDETFDTAITLIEWPEIAKSLLPANTMHITFAFADNSDYRDIEIKYN